MSSTLMNGQRTSTLIAKRSFGKGDSIIIFVSVRVLLQLECCLLMTQTSILNYWKYQFGWKPTNFLDIGKTPFNKRRRHDLIVVITGIKVEKVKKTKACHYRWRHQMEPFSALLALCVTGEFPHKGQWLGAVMFSLICAWTTGWINNRIAVDLRRHLAHDDVTVKSRGVGMNIKARNHWNRKDLLTLLHNLYHYRIYVSNQCTTFTCVTE